MNFDLAGQNLKKVFIQQILESDWYYACYKSFRRQFVAGIRFQNSGCVRFIVYAMNICILICSKDNRKKCPNLTAVFSMKIHPGNILLKG